LAGTTRGERTETVDAATYVPMESDEELIRAVAAGDERALGVLYERHAAAMLRLIRRLTRSTAVAEEILQEAWLAAWRAAGTFRGDSSLRGWLLGVARRQAHDKLRRAEVPVVPLTTEAETTPDPRTDVEVQALGRIAHQEVVRAILALPEHLREVALLALVDELPYQEIAAVIGVPVGTVKSRMAHTRTTLAEALATKKAVS
jgi:RNA polymerase sigma factor (sigma-70 family)